MKKLIGFIQLKRQGEVCANCKSVCTKKTCPTWKWLDVPESKDAEISRLNERVAELEALVEKLKVCGNCIHELSDNWRCVMCAKLDKWEAK